MSSSSSFSPGIQKQQMLSVLYSFLLIAQVMSLPRVC